MLYSSKAVSDRSIFGAGRALSVTRFDRVLA